MAAHAVLCTWWTYALPNSDDPTPVPETVAELSGAARYTAGVGVVLTGDESGGEHGALEAVVAAAWLAGGGFAA